MKPWKAITLHCILTICTFGGWILAYFLFAGGNPRSD
jgi:hypothetical protein